MKWVLMLQNNCDGYQALLEQMAAPSSSPRHKWFKLKPDIKPGDIVLVYPKTPQLFSSLLGEQDHYV